MASFLHLVADAVFGLAVPMASHKWDKPAALRWEAAANDFVSVLQPNGGGLLVHPVSGVRWVDEDEDAFAIACGALEGDQYVTRSWRFLNSAQRALNLPVDWSAIFRLATALEGMDADAPIHIEVVGRGTLDSMPAVASIASLETCLAAALVCRPVIAHKVDSAVGVRVQKLPPLEPAHGLRLGTMRRSRVGAELLADASVLSLSRDTMPLCWPKAWHFAKMMSEEGCRVPDEGSSEEAHLATAPTTPWCAAIPLRWGVEASRWESKDRHRILGGRLARVDVTVSIEMEHSLGGGRTWRLPSKTKLRMATHVQSLLLASSSASSSSTTSASGSNPTTSDADRARLVRRAREALRKAPAECDTLGITSALRRVVQQAADETRAAETARSRARLQARREAYPLGFAQPPRHPRTADSVAAAAIAAGPPQPGSAAAMALASSPPFARLAAAAMATGRAIELRGRTMSVREEVRVPAGCNLSVNGPGELIGDAHSLIRAGGNRQRVELTNVSLVHCGSSDRVERRELGGAIFALGKTHIALSACNITSAQGFGVWQVQRARVDVLAGSEIRGCGRSGVVSFGSARLTMRDSSIRDCALHGVCARGRSSISLTDSHVTGAGVRGIYCYHNVTLEMRGSSSVSGTRDEAAAAVQVEALLPGDACLIEIDAACRSRLESAKNRGAGLLIRGNVLVDES